MLQEHKDINLACHWASIRDWVNVASVCHVMDDDDLTLPLAVDFSMEPLLLFLVFFIILSMQKQF